MGATTRRPARGHPHQRPPRRSGVRRHLLLGAQVGLKQLGPGRQGRASEVVADVPEGEKAVPTCDKP